MIPCAGCGELPYISRGPESDSYLDAEDTTGSATTTGCELGRMAVKRVLDRRNFSNPPAKWMNRPMIGIGQCIGSL